MELDRAGLEVLAADDCLLLLAVARWGRVAVSMAALPAILPVRFALDDQRIVFRAGCGSALANATRGVVVAFETDGLERDGVHWSVTVTGVAHHLEGYDPAWAERLDLPSWSKGDEDRIVALEPSVLSGRRVVPGVAVSPVPAAGRAT